MRIGSKKAILAEHVQWNALRITVPTRIRERNYYFDMVLLINASELVSMMTLYYKPKTNPPKLSPAALAGDTSSQSLIP